MSEEKIEGGAAAEAAESLPLAGIIEALLFASSGPITLDAFASAIPEAPKEKIRAALDEHGDALKQRGAPVELRQIAGGWQLKTVSAIGPYIRRLHKDELTLRLSRPAAETLSIIVYQQPITRAQVDQIRGTDSAAVIKSLVERRLIRICGRKDSVGTPFLYGTTPELLQRLGLKDLSEIPSPESFQAGT